MSSKHLGLTLSANKCASSRKQIRTLQERLQIVETALQAQTGLTSHDASSPFKVCTIAVHSVCRTCSTKNEDCY